MPPTPPAPRAADARTPAFRTPALRILATAILVGALLLTGVACSNGTTESRSPHTGPTPGGRLANADELSPLADALVENHRAGGARFTATVPYGTASFVLDGEIDWSRSRGRATVTPTVTGGSGAAGGTPFELLFANDTVARAESELATVTGVPGARWLAHRLDAANPAPLDIVLLIVAKSAAPTRENTSLLAQQGVELLGRRTLDRPGGSIEAEGFRRGDATYWVDGEGRAVRIENTLAATRSSITIDLGEFGPREVAAPDGPLIDEARLSEEQRAALGDPG